MSRGTRAMRASMLGERPKLGAWSSTSSFRLICVYRLMAAILPHCYIPSQWRRCFCREGSHRSEGRRVLRPMGFDSFGLNAENAAIRDGGHPRDIVRDNIRKIRAQMKRMGWAIDWDREVASHEPEYYRWTQWLFLQFFKAGQAFRKEAPVKWCPKDQTVLANEQVIDGRCERCGTIVESKSLEQWVFRYTTYADELLDEMALLESWPERVLASQRN